MKIQKLEARHSSETTWQREASKLRDDLVEAAGAGPDLEQVQGDLYIVYKCSRWFKQMHNDALVLSLFLSHET